MTETWVEIKGYEGLYSVSNLGNVKSEQRITKRTSNLGNNANYCLKEKILKPWKTTKGYLEVTLRKENKACVFLVHRLVARAFLGEIPENLEVCHWNGVRTDNFVENLRIDTVSSNRLDMRRHKTDRRGAGHPLAKLTKEQVMEIRKNNSKSQNALATRYNVARSTIWRIKHGISWGNIA